MHTAPKKKLIILIFILLTACYTAIAQFEVTSIDSLKIILKETRLDTVKAKVLAEIGQEYISIQPDSALYYLKIAEALAKKIQYRKGEAMSLNYLGRYHRDNGQYYIALDYFLKSLNVKGYKDEKRTTAITLYDLGQLYSNLSATIRTAEIREKRIHYFRKAIEAFKELDLHDHNGEMKFLEAGAYLEIGRAFMSNAPTLNLDSAQYNIESALTLMRELKSNQFMALVYADLANLYFIKKEHQKAIDKAQEAISLAKQVKVDFFLPPMYGNLARFHNANDNPDSAYYYIQKSINTQSVSPDSINYSSFYQILGEIHFKQRNYYKAIENYKQLMVFSQNRSVYLDLEVAYSNLTECYKRLGDYKNALKYQVLNSHLRDSVLNEETHIRLANLHSQFDAALQQSQIELLSKETEIKTITIERSRTIQLFIIIGLFFALIIILVFFYQNRIIKKSRDQQARAFKQLDTLKSRFFANISHEFRTPLTLILTPVEKKLKESSSPEEKKEFSSIHRSASRLLSLVNQLLDLSKLEAGTLKLNLSYTNLGSFLSPVISQFASIAESKNVNFNSSLADSVELFIDQDKVEKIVTNLLSNAFKFTPTGGTVGFSISKINSSSTYKEGCAQLEVTDSGIGIDPEHLPKIFNRFYQVDSSSTRRNEGSGIGLALTKELVDLHHGNIAVKSEAGKGTKFTVELPLGFGHVKSDELTAETPVVNSVVDYPILEIEDEKLNTQAAEETILVIEDNYDLRQFIKTELGKFYHILEAVDGNEGLTLAFEKIPTLVLSDLMMPNKDGLELCNILKADQRTSHIPIILLTARTDVETKLQGLRTGADDYIPKPFQLDELMIRIQNLVVNRKKLREKFSRQLTLQPTEVAIESVDDRFLKNVTSIVEEHLTDSSFGVEIFAREVGMSQAQLYRKLHAITDFTPNELIRHMRLLRAAELLKKKAGNVAEVAYMVGFNNLSYFAKCFKEKFKVTPSEFLNLPEK